MLSSSGSRCSRTLPSWGNGRKEGTNTNDENQSIHHIFHQILPAVTTTLLLFHKQPYLFRPCCHRRHSDGAAGEQPPRQSTCGHPPPSQTQTPGSTAPPLHASANESEWWCFVQKYQSFFSRFRFGGQPPLSFSIVTPSRSSKADEGFVERKANSSNCRGIKRWALFAVCSALLLSRARDTCCCAIVL